MKRIGNNLHSKYNLRVLNYWELKRLLELCKYEPITIRYKNKSDFIRHKQLNHRRDNLRIAVNRELRKRLAL